MNLIFEKEKKTHKIIKSFQQQEQEQQQLQQEQLTKSYFVFLSLFLFLVQNFSITLYLMYRNKQTN